VGGRRQRSWLVYATAGLAWAVAYLVLPRHTLLSGVLSRRCGFVCAVAVVVGVPRHRPTRRAPWYLFAAAQGCFGAGGAPVDGGRRVHTLTFTEGR